jgi:hypothetical protein
MVFPTPLAKRKSRFRLEAISFSVRSLMPEESYYFPELAPLASDFLAGSTHQALKFGREARTPVMQAGLTPRRLRLRGEIFSSRMAFLVSKNVIFMLFNSAPSLDNILTEPPSTGSKPA